MPASGPGARWQAPVGSHDYLGGCGHAAAGDPAAAMTGNAMFGAKVFAALRISPRAGWHADRATTSIQVERRGKRRPDMLEHAR